MPAMYRVVDQVVGFSRSSGLVILTVTMGFSPGMVFADVQDFRGEHLGRLGDQVHVTVGDGCPQRHPRE